MLVDLARSSGVKFITVHPNELDVDSSPDVSDGSPGERPDRLERRVSIHGDIHVVIDPVVDGRERIRDVVACWPKSRGPSEKELGQALFGDAGEPDLVVVLGPAHRLPKSLVWELAYGELVFIDASWRRLAGEHLWVAIDDFSQRQRRFGGVE